MVGIAHEWLADENVDRVLEAPDVHGILKERIERLCHSHVHK